MSRWDLFETFVHIVDTGSLTAAAKKLDVSRSLVSRQLSQLEARLGTQLLYRTTRSINPTEAGGALYQECARLFSGLEDAERAVLNLGEVASGHLRIVCTDILGEQYIARAAAQFCKIHPAVTIDVHVTMRTVDLIGEGYDIAVRYGELNDSSFKARRVMDLDHVVCASPEYLKRHGKPARVADLNKHNCLVATFAPCTTWQFRQDGSRVEVELSGNWRSNNGSAIISAALEDIGICRLPYLYVREWLRTGKLIRLLEDYESDPLTVWMVFPNTRYIAPKTRLFIEYFVNNVEKLINEDAFVVGKSAHSSVAVNALHGPQA